MEEAMRQAMLQEGEPMYKAT
jgi:hypothetical protein